MLSSADLEFICISLLNQTIFGFFIVTLAPFLILRWLVTQARVFVSSNTQKIVSAISCTYTTEDIENSTGNNVIFCLKLEGKLDVHKTLERISQLVHRTNQKTGKLIFPELQMYWVKWFGCPVWRLENNFNVNKHVFRAIIPNNCDQDEFISIFEKDMVRKPFKPKESPWEIALVDGIDEPMCWYWLFKFHHSLADGHSVFKALMTCVDNYVPIYEPKMPTCSIFTKVFKFASYPYVGLYEWIKLSLDSSHPNPWKMPVAQMSPNSRLIAKSRSIPCSHINKISKENNVSFTAVLMAAVTGGIHNVMKKQRKDIPDYIVTRMPVPAPIKHPDGLTNNFTAVFMKLPTGVEDSSERIKRCETEIEVVKKSTCSLTSYLMTNLFGAFPTSLQKRFPPSFQAIQISNFPGPKDLITIGGQRVVDMDFIVWCAQRNPMYLSVLSYNGRIRFVANVDPNIFPSENLLKGFVREIEKQLD